MYHAFILVLSQNCSRGMTGCVCTAYTLLLDGLRKGKAAEEPAPAPAKNGKGKGKAEEPKETGATTLQQDSCNSAPCCCHGDPAFSSHAMQQRCVEEGFSSTTGSVDEMSAAT